MSKMSELHAEVTKMLSEPFPALSERKREAMQRLFDAQWEGDKEAEAAALHELIVIAAKEQTGDSDDPPF